MIIRATKDKAVLSFEEELKKLEEIADSNIELIYTDIYWGIINTYMKNPIINNRDTYFSISKEYSHSCDSYTYKNITFNNKIETLAKAYNSINASNILFYVSNDERLNGLPFNISKLMSKLKSDNIGTYSIKANSFEFRISTYTFHELINSIVKDNNNIPLSGNNPIKK